MNKREREKCKEFRETKKKEESKKDRERKGFMKENTKN